MAVTDKSKRPKSEVDYSTGMASSHCGICSYYNDGTCSRVRGKIDSGMWCKLFKRKL